MGEEKEKDPLQVRLPFLLLQTKFPARLVLQLLLLLLLLACCSCIPESVCTGFAAEPAAAFARSNSSPGREGGRLHAMHQLVNGEGFLGVQADKLPHPLQEKLVVVRTPQQS